ncbi:pyridoxal phosphate-dependent aminotransferase [Yoonia sp.]|uniref:pyridoxal phosphate-dependent aminotransferase n=1 Tax=Yoonia sp. TaxID=2212373 RepID=UPI0019FD0F5A|nr:pyridoxal phosphate-dependent aminotransferase [Yoonia sp.]MBE0414585.1 pyridoxal phosphate-dependent aminotransferase [Yoonia sp.]
MKLSTRITSITGGGSDGWDVFYRARRMIADGIPVTELTIGEHDIRTHPDILGAMQASARGGHTGYATVPGTTALRSAIAHRIAARTGVPTAPANILVTPGGQAGLFAAHMAVCNQDDPALFIDPYYVTYPGTIRAVGAVPRAIVTSPETAFQPTASAIAAAARGAVSLLVNTPNNPTGAVYSPQTLNDIARVCQDHDLWLISDEVYDTQVWDGTHISPRALPGMADRTLVVGSMSKSHAMTGSRIGWVCAPEHVIAHLLNLATHTTYGVAGFIQDAATYALHQGADLENTVAAPFRRRRALTLQALAGQNIVRALPIEGAMYAMLDIRATGLSSADFANALLDAEKIAVMPGESFGNAAAGHIRVAMTIDDDRYVAALHRLVGFADRCKPKH